MPINVLKSFINRCTLQSVKHLHITMFGGEPLLMKNFLYELFDDIARLSELRNFKYTSGIASNGYLLDKPTCQFLDEKCNTQNFQITIDGCRRTHNQTRRLANGKESFDIILENFKNLLSLQKQRKHIVLRINLLNNTLSDIEETLALFTSKERELFEIYFRPIYNTVEFSEENQNKTNLEMFYRLAKRMGFRIDFGNYVHFWHCEGDGGFEQLHITPDLSVWKCINDTSYEEAKIGFINDKGELKINDRKLDNWMENNPFKDPKCTKCKLLPICLGGCPLHFRRSNIRTCLYEKNFNIIDMLV